MGGCRLTRTQTNSYLANSYLSQLVPNANPYPSQPVPSTNYSQTKSYPKKVKALILHILAANEETTQRSTSIKSQLSSSLSSHVL